MTRPAVSFEFFPPKTIAGSFRLWDCVNTLAPFDPKMVSVTYGAGGATRALTHEAVSALWWITARFAPSPDGFASSVDLIGALAKTGDFNIAVGAYPETHPEAATPQANIDYLKRKIDAGATSAITQFFFEAETFLRFRDDCVAAGIDAPIIPGILPVENWAGTRRFAASCGTSIPPLIVDAFENAQRDDRHELMATAFATEFCDDLLQEGVEHLHFYTLNKPELTRDVCHALGLTPQARLQKVA